MSKRSALRKISEMQLYPLAFNITKTPTSWVSLRNKETETKYNVDYVVIHKPKSKISFSSMSAYFNAQMLVWDMITLFSIVVNYFLITITYIFARPKSLTTWHFYAILVGDIIYCLDVILALANYFNRQIKPYTVEKSRHILWILFDLFLTIPFSAIYLGIVRDSSSAIFLLLRLCTLVRLYRLPLGFKQAENMVCNIRWTLFLIKYFTYCILLQHFGTCIIYMMLNAEEENWSTTIKNESYFSITGDKWYLVGYYFSNSLLFNCGLGDVHPITVHERFVSACIMFLGLFFWVFYISSITILFWRSKYKYFNIFRRSNLMLRHLRFINSEKALIKKIRNYFDTFLLRKAGILTTDKLKYLPDDVVASMNYEASYSWLRCSIVFKDKPDAFLRNVAGLIRYEFYMPGQDIFTECQLKDKMIILQSGIINVLSEEDHESPVLSFGHGTCLGEVALITCIPSKVTVRASTFVEVQAIYTEDFIRCTLTHPDFFIDVRDTIYKRMIRVLSIDRKRSNVLKSLKNVLNQREESKIIITKFLMLYKIETQLKKKQLRMQRLTSAWIRSEDSFISLLWDTFIVICAIVVVVFYPYFAAYERKFPEWFDNVSTGIHVIYVIDIIALLTTSVEKRGKVVNSFAGILNYRLDSIGFNLDVISSFYLEVFAPLTSDEARFSSILKLNRLLKIHRLFALCNKMKYEKLLSSLRISFVKCTAIMVLYVYWFSILMYMTTCFYESCVYNGWYIKKMRDSIEARIIATSSNGKFILSLVYSSSIALAVGIGDILPKNQTDLVFSIYGVLIGKVMIGYYLAEMIALALLRRNSYNKFQEHLGAINFYAEKRVIPYKLVKRLLNYFKIWWERDEANQFVTGKSLSVDLPRILKYEVKAEECLETMRKFPIFDDLGDEFIGFLMKEARIITLGPSEIVTYFGSINREMYIICRGFCLQQTESNNYKTIGAGTAVGFSSLLFGLPSMNNTYTATHCVLVYINVTTFNNALRHSASLYRIVYRARKMVLAKYNANYEVRMIENPHYTKMRAKIKMKYRKINEKLDKQKSFVNAYKYCLYSKESYGKLQNRTGKMCFLKYLLMPVTILPNGSFIKIWQAVRLLSSLVVFFCVPIEYLLAPHRHQLHYFLVVTDIIAYLDMYLRLHVAYYGRQNQLIIHPWSTAERYLTGPFILDLLIWFPYAALVLAFNKDHVENHSDASHSFSPHFFHCSVHLIKTLDAYRIIATLKYLSEELIENNFFHFFKYLFYSILLIHAWSVVIIANTCTYLHMSDIPRKYTSLNNVTSLPDMIPKQSSDFNMYCFDKSWLNRSAFRDYHNFGEVYVASSYWITQTLTGIGFGDVFGQNRKELIFSVFIIMTGFLFYGYVLVDIVSRTVRAHTNLLRYEAKFLHLMSYMKFEKVCRSVLIKIEEHVQYNWQRTRGYDVHTLLSTVNCTLHEDTMLFLYESTLRHVPLFENLDHSFFRVFGKELQEEYFMEGDIVLSGNDIVNDIYIIHRGAVEISSPHNMVPVIMGIGGIFGNVFERNTSLCGIIVRALKNLDVLCLNVETFRKMLKDYPFIQKKIGAFTKTEAQKHYAIPNSFVDEGNVYINPNLFWSSKRQFNSKNTAVNFCRGANQSFIFNMFSCFILFTAYSNSILTTYQFSFQHFSGPLLITTVIIDIIFLLKFCVEMNTSYMPQVNLSNKRFWKWRKTVDFFANLPFSYSILFLPFLSPANAHFYFSILRLVTLLRMYYMFQYYGYYRKKLIHNRLFLELCVLLTYSTLTIHILTCFWYLIICPFNMCAEFTWMPSINRNNSQELYITSLYLTVDILSGTGIGDVVPRGNLHIITVVMYMIFAKIFLGYLISQLITVLQSKNIALVKFEAMIHELKNYYLNTGLKENRTAYVCKYLRLLWKRNYGVQDYKIIKSLPRTLQIELMDSVYGSLLKDSYIFCQTERDFLRQLSLFLKHKTFFPGNYIVRDGDVDNSMYFIHRGDVQILTVNTASKETVHEVLHKSEVFGIVQGLFKEIPHHFSFRALSIVDLAVLKLNDWEFLLDFFPKSKDVIYQRVEEIYYTI